MRGEASQASQGQAHYSWAQLFFGPRALGLFFIWAHILFWALGPAYYPFAAYYPFVAYYRISQIHDFRRTKNQGFSNFPGPFMMELTSPGGPRP